MFLVDLGYLDSMQHMVDPVGLRYLPRTVLGLTLSDMDLYWNSGLCSTSSDHAIVDWTDLVYVFVRLDFSRKSLRRLLLVKTILKSRT